MQSVAAYFGLENSSQLNWAHRINTPKKLAAACADATLHVMEADIQFGQGEATPLVADGSKPTDLDLATFLTTAIHAGKAVKLDFHSAAAIEPTLATLRFLKPTTPVILYADVFMLLSGKHGESLEPEQFIRLCQTALPTALISLGWSLKRVHDADGRVEDALIQQLSAMVLQRLGAVTYGLEIRAGYTPGWERGAALILDPMPATMPPISKSQPQAKNVVDITARLRRVA